MFKLCESVPYVHDCCRLSLVKPEHVDAAPLDRDPVGNLSKSVGANDIDNIIVVSNDLVFGVVDFLARLHLNLEWVKPLTCELLRVTIL